MTKLAINSKKKSSHTKYLTNLLLTLLIQITLCVYIYIYLLILEDCMTYKEETGKQCSDFLLLYLFAVIKHFFGADCFFTHYNRYLAGSY